MTRTTQHNQKRAEEVTTARIIAFRGCQGVPSHRGQRRRTLAIDGMDAAFLRKLARVRMERPQAFAVFCRCINLMNERIEDAQ